MTVTYFFSHSRIFFLQFIVASKNCPKLQHIIVMNSNSNSNSNNTDHNNNNSVDNIINKNNTTSPSLPANAQKRPEILSIKEIEELVRLVNRSINNDDIVTTNNTKSNNNIATTILKTIRTTIPIN